MSNYLEVSSVCLALLVTLGVGVGCNQYADDDGRALLGDTGGGGSADIGVDGSQGPVGIPFLGNGSNSLEAVDVTTVATGEDGLAFPTDLEFNPANADQLWIVNREDSSAVVIDNAGTDNQSSEKYDGLASDHFMVKPAAIAFGKEGYFATAQQEDEKTQEPTPADFMGPALWTADLDTFDAGHAGHLDMLHNSPNASGAAWDNEGHAYWIFDGYHNSITRYDFGEPHPPGGTDHSDGVVHRYVEGEVSFVDGVPAHLEMKRKESATTLYIADTGNNRIAVLDTETGEVGERIYPNYDGGTQRRVTGAEIKTLIDGETVGLSEPTGLELHEDRLFVSDHATSTIYAFDLDGVLIDKLDVSGALDGGSVMGMSINSEGELFVVTGQGNRVIRLSGLSE